MTGLSFFQLHPAFDIRGEPKSTISVAAGERAQETEERKEPGRINWRQTQTSNFGLLGKKRQCKRRPAFYSSILYGRRFCIARRIDMLIASIPFQPHLSISCLLMVVNIQKYRTKNKTNKQTKPTKQSVLGSGGSDIWNEQWSPHIAWLRHLWQHLAYGNTEPHRAAKHNKSDRRFTRFRGFKGALQDKRLNSKRFVRKGEEHSSDVWCAVAAALAAQGEADASPGLQWVTLLYVVLRLLLCA